MCRLLGVIASSPAPLAELLGDELPPFLGQAGEHGNGWGVSYLDPSDHVVTVKEPISARASSVFGLLVADTATTAAILHLRLASPGLAATSANTHPFGDSHCGFAHNGAFFPVGALDPVLGPALSAAAGDTDSERYYLAVRHRMNAGCAPAAAIAASVADIQALAAGWESLNCLLLTPQGLHAYCDHSPDSEVLKRRGPDFFNLHYLVEPGRVIVASTGSARPPVRWRRLPGSRVLEVHRDLQFILHEKRLVPGTRSKQWHRTGPW